MADIFSQRKRSAVMAAIRSWGLDGNRRIRESDSTMKTTLTKFQREFRAARAAADRGEPVTIAAGTHSYRFERVTAGAGASPFAGLRGVFGAVRLGRDPRPAREKIRARLDAKHRDH